jgi:glycosyltransferase involved in cell wall biosynthesis
MNNYQNVDSLSHLENFVEEGGFRNQINKDKIKTQKPFFSIITVVKNSSDTIESTIKSVINQNHKDIEYIVIDGNSNDDTLNKIKSYNNKINYWCCIRDKGIYDAMNYGLKLASGQVIGIINSGDIYTRSSFDIVKKYFIQKENLSFLFGTVERHYLGNNIIVKTGFNKNRIKYNFDSQTCHSSGFFIKSDVQKKIGLYNTKYICSSDYDLFYKIFLDKNLIGESTTKDELIGVVQAGGFSSKYGFWKKLKEEIQIRIDNKQNVIFIFIILVNILLKKGVKKLFNNFV